MEQQLPFIILYTNDVDGVVADDVPPSSVCSPWALSVVVPMVPRREDGEGGGRPLNDGNLMVDGDDKAPPTLSLM
jgi:hypothetical protein